MDNDNLPRRKSTRTRQKATAQIIGVSGKTYGLQLPQNNEPSTERLHMFESEPTEDSASSEPTAVPMRTYGGERGGEEDDLNKEREMNGVEAVIAGKEEKHLAAWSMSLAAAANAERLRRESKATQEKILAEDPSVYEYDSIYDELHKGRAQEEKLKAADSAQRLPKYMLCMQKKAERRKHFLDAAYVKKLQREAEKGRAIYGDKEVFVSESYKRKLMESKLWEDEDNAGVEEGGNVNNSEFYSNLIRESVDARKALGAELNEDSLLLKKLQEKQKGVGEVGVGVGEVGEVGGSQSSTHRQSESKEDTMKHKRDPEEDQSPPSKRFKNETENETKKEGGEIEERERRERERDYEEEEIERRERREEAERVAARRREVEKGFFEAQKAQKVEAARQKAEQEARLARRNTQESIKSAREKYLERKNKLAADLKAAREKANENK